MKQESKSEAAVSGHGKSGLPAIDSRLLGAITVSLEAKLGERTMTIEELSALQKGSLVALDTGLADHAELYLNDTLIARGEIMAVGDNYGVRIVEIVSEK